MGGGARLPVVNGRQVIRALARAGFIVERIVGSHHILAHPHDLRRTVTIPVHAGRDLKRGTLRSICPAGWIQRGRVRRSAVNGRRAPKRPDKAPKLSPCFYPLVARGRYVSPATKGSVNGHDHDLLPENRASNFHWPIRCSRGFPYQPGLFQPDLLSTLPRDARVVRQGRVGLRFRLLRMRRRM